MIIFIYVPANFLLIANCVDIDHLALVEAVSHQCLHCLFEHFCLNIGVNQIGLINETDTDKLLLHFCRNIGVN